jgi:hypothetical protein
MVYNGGSDSRTRAREKHTGTARASAAAFAFAPHTKKALCPHHTTRYIHIDACFILSIINRYTHFLFETLSARHQEIISFPTKSHIAFTSQLAACTQPFHCKQVTESTILSAACVLLRVLGGGMCLRVRLLRCVALRCAHTLLVCAPYTHTHTHTRSAAAPPSTNKHTKKNTSTGQPMQS